MAQIQISFWLAVRMTPTILGFLMLPGKQFHLAIVSLCYRIRVASVLQISFLNGKAFTECTT